MESIINSLTTSAGSTVSMQVAFLYVLAAGVLGLIISQTYIRTGDSISKNFARTLIILPMLVSVVITMVNGSLGTSVAILGAFGLIRFRSLQGTSRDISYIFFTMVVGLSCSVGYVLFAAGITVIICMIQLFLYVTEYGERTSTNKDLRVTIPENLDYVHIFDDLFEQYTRKHVLYKVKTTNMGSLYELSYHVWGIKEEEEKEFLDEIRVRNGNLTVICGQVNKGEEL